jgi:formate-dependent nitrite reductase membrane component NrfD
MLTEDIKPYEYMIYPTLQTAWSRGKGSILFLGLYLVELGAGIFLAASILNSLWGMAAGWLISGAFGGGCHFLFLGHPFRIYRAIRRPGKSWISRGLFIISLFQLIGLIHIVLTYLNMTMLGIKIAAIVMAIATILYGGYEIADVKSIRTWNSSFFPIQMLARSFFIGLSIVLIVSLLLGMDIAGVNIKGWLMVAILINVFLFGLGLASIGFEEGKEKLSLNMMVKGSLKWLFWPWVIVGGMLIPLIISIYGFATGVDDTGIIILLIAVLLQVIGDSFLRFGLIKSGYYQSIFPAIPLDFR